MDAPGLSYLLANPTALGLTVLRPALLLLLAATPVFFLWPARTGSPRARRAATLLRAAAFACVVLALAGVRLTARIPSDHLTVVAAVDVSDSVDAAGREWERRYLNELRRRLAPGDQLAVLRFAGDVELLRPLDGTAALDTLGTSSASATTDVSAAIASAMTLLPADGPRRLLLLTDGNETRGDARRQIPWLRAAGV
ncbi:MAG: vWA domain-containing protein, partial [Candidatus Binatia bacterium]